MRLAAVFILTLSLLASQADAASLTPQVRSSIQSFLRAHGRFVGKDYISTCDGGDHKRLRRGPFTYNVQDYNVVTPSDVDRMNGITRSYAEMTVTIDFKYQRDWTNPNIMSAQPGWSPWGPEENRIELDITTDAKTGKVTKIGRAPSWDPNPC